MANFLFDKTLGYLNAERIYFDNNTILAQIRGEIMSDEVFDLKPHRTSDVLSSPLGLSPAPLGFLWLRRKPRSGGKEEQMATTEINVKITANDKVNPPGKLADVELHFNAGPLAELKLIGFAIWERRTGGGRHVTFPARQFGVNGERRSFALLRAVTDSAAQERIRELILDAYVAFEERASLAS